MTYSKSFVNLVDKLSNLKTESETVESYIGTGNPNSKIIIFGKELGFEANNTTQFSREVLNNIKDWKLNIKKNIDVSDINFEIYNPLLPYNSCKQKSGHTWSKYQILSNLVCKNELSFFENFFISEIGHKPSKYSKHQGLSSKRRELIKENLFFQEFRIIILACGNYLSSSDIESIFSVNHKISKSLPRNRLEIYQSENKLIINTRQLSMDVLTTYLQEIKHLIIDYMK